MTTNGDELTIKVKLISQSTGGTSLESGLLRLYEQALAQRDWEVAEHLL